MIPFPFRLCANREQAEPVLVFAYAGEPGRVSGLPTYACPASLAGFHTVTRVLASVSDDSTVLTSQFPVYGLVLILTRMELARLDSYADSRGLNYHRFQAEVVMRVAGGTAKKLAWVYQDVIDATPLTISSSSNPSLFSAA